MWDCQLGKEELAEAGGSVFTPGTPWLTQNCHTKVSHQSVTLLCHTNVSHNFVTPFCTEKSKKPLYSSSNSQSLRNVWTFLVILTESKNILSIDFNSILFFLTFLSLFVWSHLKALRALSGLFTYLDPPNCHVSFSFTNTSLITYSVKFFLVGKVRHTFSDLCGKLNFYQLQFNRW